MGVQEGLELRGSHKNPEREGQGRKRLEEAACGGRRGGRAPTKWDPRVGRRKIRISHQEDLGGRQEAAEAKAVGCALMGLPGRPQLIPVRAAASYTGLLRV